MRGTALLVFGVLLAAGETAAAEEQPELRLELVNAEASSPLFLCAPPGATRLFVVERAGRIRVISGGVLDPEPFLDITARVTAGGERGLLGMAFHPGYAGNGAFFVNYTATETGQLHTRVSRFTVPGDPMHAAAADPESEEVLLRFDQPLTNHNGGMIAFGPLDGLLYIAAGDGGGANDPLDTGQRLDTMLGKMLRIGVDGATDGLAHAIPPDNPFVDVTGALPQIWSYGLRNPWRFSFDRATGDLYIADVGQNAREEINFQPAASAGGENYGWRIFEGTLCNSGIAAVSPEDCDALAAEAVMPVHEYPNPADGRSVTGGYVYRGGAMPEWNGRYFFADYLSNRLWSFRIEAGARVDFAEHTAAVNPGGQVMRNIASFGEDGAGELYLVSLNGEVWRLGRDPSIAPDYQVLLAQFDALDANGDGLLSLDEARSAMPAFPEPLFAALDRAGAGGLSKRALRAATTHGPVHGVDRNRTGQIELDELLRVVQLFNAGEFHCDPDSEDGYATGPGPRGCLRHPADAALDWRVSLGELLRIVQFFNLGGYRFCPDEDSEDGYCPILS